MCQFKRNENTLHWGSAEIEQSLTKKGCLFWLFKRWGPCPWQCITTLLHSWQGCDLNYSCTPKKVLSVMFTYRDHQCYRHVIQKMCGSLKWQWNLYRGSAELSEVLQKRGCYSFDYLTIQELRSLPMAVCQDAVTSWTRWGSQLLLYLKKKKK